MDNQLNLILYRSHKGIIAQVERLARQTPEAKQLLETERELVKNLEMSLPKSQNKRGRDA